MPPITDPTHPQPPKKNGLFYLRDISVKFQKRSVQNSISYIMRGQAPANIGPKFIKAKCQKFRHKCKYRKFAEPAIYIELPGDRFSCVKCQ